MSNALSQAIVGILSFVKTVVTFTFSTPFPGFNSISIGGVLVALFIVSLGFTYLEYFLNASGMSESNVQKRGKK